MRPYFATYGNCILNGPIDDGAKDHGKTGIIWIFIDCIQLFGILEQL